MNALQTPTHRLGSQVCLPKMTLWIKNRFVRQMLNLTQHLSVVSVIFQPDWMDLEAVATKVVRPIRRRRTHLLS